MSCLHSHQQTLSFHKRDRHVQIAIIPPLQIAVHYDLRNSTKTNRNSDKLENIRIEEERLCVEKRKKERREWNLLSVSQSLLPFCLCLSRDVPLVQAFIESVVEEFDPLGVAFEFLFRDGTSSTEANHKRTAREKKQ